MNIDDPKFSHSNVNRFITEVRDRKIARHDQHIDEALHAIRRSLHSVHEVIRESEPTADLLRIGDAILRVQAIVVDQSVGVAAKLERLGSGLANLVESTRVFTMPKAAIEGIRESATLYIRLVYQSNDTLLMKRGVELLDLLD